MLPLPLADDLILVGSAPSVWLPRLVVVLLPLLVDPLEVVFLGSAVPLGWWVHFYPCLCFYPSAGAFVGLDAEVFVPCLDILCIGKGLAHIHLSEDGI